jgi:hypothetical protein
MRIRPVERDGKVRLRADVKEKEGSGKFVAKASWEAPPPLSGDQEDGQGPFEAPVGFK